MPRKSALLALAFATVALPVASAEIRETTTYFDVRGSTLAELDADLQRRGPTVGTGGARHPGATSVRFDGQVSYSRENGRCRVADTQLRLDLEMTLPRWRQPREATAETAVIWRTISDDIVRHEQEHADIARLWARRMESALRNLAPQRDCAAMERRVTATTQRYLTGHERAQREFDVAEGRAIAQRLRRTLRANLQAEEARAQVNESGG